MPAASAPSKSGITKRGSTAFMTRSTPWRRARSATAAASRGVDALDREARRVTELDLQRGGPVEVVVREHHLLAPVAPRGHPGDRLANGADSDLQDAHADAGYSTWKAVRMPSW